MIDGSPRLLAVKLADLGDLLTATPALRALRLAYPQARIDALVTPHAAPLLQGSDAVDHTVTFAKAAFDRPGTAVGAPLLAAARLAARLRGGSYDAVLLFHHLTTSAGVLKYRLLLAATGAPVRAGLDNGRGDFLTHRVPDHGFGARPEAEYWLSVAEQLGACHPRPRLELPLSAAELAAGRERLAALVPSGPVAFLHPGCGRFSLARRWPPERFARVGDGLVESFGMRVVVVGGPREERLAGAVRRAMQAPAALLVGEPDPRALAATLAAGDLFIGNDSGVMHLAVAVGLRVVAIFGPSNWRAWGPYPPGDPRHTVVALDLPCSPCIHRGHRLGTPAGCPPRPCLTSLSPALVLAAAERVLSAAPVGSTP